MNAVPPPSRLFSFVAGSAGPWCMQSVDLVVGDPAEVDLPLCARLSMVLGPVDAPSRDASWALRGIVSNERYVERDEKSALVARQEGLGRAAARCAALIPIRKTAAWWAFPQNERRNIFETLSHHIGIGMRYLPSVARRLHHCRDLGPDEPFDFLTWFEFAPADAASFDALLLDLRSTPEWAWIDREVDIRLVRDDGH